jgi:hypothetical protein
MIASSDRVPRLRCSTPPAHAPVTARDKRKRSWTGKASPCGVVEPASQRTWHSGGGNDTGEASLVPEELARLLCLPPSHKITRGCGLWPWRAGHARARTTDDPLVQAANHHPTSPPRSLTCPPVQRRAVAHRSGQGRAPAPPGPAPSPASACSGLPPPRDRAPALGLAWLRTCLKSKPKPLRPWSRRRHPHRRHPRPRPAAAAAAAAAAPSRPARRTAAASRTCPPQRTAPAGRRVRGPCSSPGGPAASGRRPCSTRPGRGTRWRACSAPPSSSASSRRPRAGAPSSARGWGAASSAGRCPPRRCGWGRRRTSPPWLAARSTTTTRRRRCVA